MKANALLGLLLALPAAALADQAREQITTDKFDNCARDRFVCAGADSAGARLAHSWLLATEEGVTSKHPQPLSPSNQIKKVFDIPLSECDKAVLCIFRGGGSPDNPMRIQFNDRMILHDAKHLTAGDSGWEYEPLPPELIRKGTNTLIFSGTGDIPLDTRSPNRGSAVSYDGGRLWHPAPGEYMVRLRIFGYPPEGTLTSEVFDTALGVDPKRLIGPWPRYERAVIEADKDAPPETEIAFQWRAGTTRRFSPENWTPWQDGTEVKLAGARYVQWRAILQTSNGAKTPLLKGVHLRLLQKTAPIPAEASDLQVMRYDRPEDAPESYEFTYEGRTPRIRYLADKYKLAAVPPADGTDLVKTDAIRFWCSHQWNKGWDDGKYEYCPPWDALILLDMKPPDLCLGMCTHYSTVYVQSSTALGYISKHVILDGHLVAETYLNDLGQWAIQDTGPGPGPTGFPIGVHYEANGIPLNALEMHRLLLASGTALAIPEKAEGEPAVTVATGTHLSPSASPYREKLNLYSCFGIPLRNNHLSVPEPAEEEHGFGYFHYNGYLWWADNPDNPLQTVSHFSLLSNRPADFYPKVNQTWIDLEQKEKRVLAVALSNHMPNFSQYEARVDNGEWKKSEGASVWPLHPGTNTFAARSVNTFGVPGPLSVVEIVAPN